MKDPEFGKVLKACRERARLSQEELAKLLMVDQAIVSKAETGKMAPSYALVKLWARETKSEDIIGMDLGGTDGWKKLKQLEEFTKGLKSKLEAISFMRIGRKGGKAHGIKQGSAR